MTNAILPFKIGTADAVFADLKGRLRDTRWHEAETVIDWGSAVTTALGARDAAHCAGIHITLAMQSRAQVTGEPTPEEARALQRAAHHADWDVGYAKQQSTRSQTLAYGLTDSPAGEAAWILEKFQARTDCDGHPETIFSRDELLDNLMVYWVTASAASSARLYWKSFAAFEQPGLLVEELRTYFRTLR